MPYPYSLTFPHALELTAITGNTAGIKTYGFVAEFDCELVCDYEDADNWEITGVTITKTRWAPEFTITAQSDPNMWVLISRALGLDDKKIEAIAQERIADALSERKYYPEAAE